MLNNNEKRRLNRTIAFTTGLIIANQVLGCIHGKVYEVLSRQFEQNQQLYNQLDTTTQKFVTKVWEDTSGKKSPEVKDLVHQCFSVINNYWKLKYHMTLTSYRDAGYDDASSHEHFPIMHVSAEDLIWKKSINGYSLRSGDIVYFSTHPGVDTSSTKMMYKPHWVIYLGNGFWFDNKRKVNTGAEVLHTLKYWRELPPSSQMIQTMNSFSGSILFPNLKTYKGDKHYVSSYFKSPKIQENTSEMTKYNYSISHL